MATIKSFTSVQQSRKLAEILPLESADMYFEKGIGDSYKEAFGNYADRRIAEIMLGIKTIPCWSLAALLSVLPNNENIHTNLSKGGYRIPTHEYTNSWFADYEDETNGYNCVTSADNPVDTCYKLILKLYERKML